MSNHHVKKPYAIFLIPHDFEELDEYSDALKVAGFEIAVVTYGNAEQEEGTGDTWRWITETCETVEVVIWPGVDFSNVWILDEIKDEKGKITEIIARLVAMGAVVFKANYDYDVTWYETVIMRGPPDLFVSEVLDAVNRQASGLKTAATYSS